MLFRRPFWSAWTTLKSSWGTQISIAFASTTLTCGVFVFSFVSALLTHSLARSLTHTHSLTRSSLLGRRGTTSIAKGSDVHPGIPLVSLGLRRFCVAGMAQRPLPRVGCTPWRPSGVPWSPPLLCARRGTMRTAKGSDVRSGVPLVSLVLRLFCVAGVGQCALLVAFAWQAWDNVNTHTHMLRTVIANSDVECILRAKSTPVNLAGESWWHDPRKIEK